MFIKELPITALLCVISFITGLLLGLHDNKKQLHNLYKLPKWFI